MWFDDDDVSRRKLFPGRRGGRNRTILNVNTRLGEKKSTQRVGVGALLAVAVVGCTVFLWLGGAYAWRVLFSENDRFIIRNLPIEEGTTINRDLIKEYTQIKEGLNLFAFDMPKVRKDFIRQVYNAKSIEIRRELPSTVKIRVIERVPVARIGRKSLFAVDAEGYVFGLKAGYRALPVITGYRDPGLRPGSQLVGTSLAALDVLEACYDSKIALHVDEVDVNNPEQLIVYIPEGDRVKEVPLAWQDMGKRTTESRKKLQEKLAGLMKALQTPEGRAALRLDATIDGKFFASGARTAG